MKIALFDFCETLVSFQTADAFISFVSNRHPNLIHKGINYYIQKFFEKTKLSSVLFKLGLNINKHLLLLRFKGLTYELIENEGRLFYETCIKSHYIKESINELQRLKSENYIIYIVSGGLDAYLHYFAEDYNVNLICSELSYTDRVCNGKLKYADCMNKEKIWKLRRILHVDNLHNIDSIAYSDSIADLPLLQFAKRAVVVTKSNKKWINKYNFTKLLWQE